MLRRKLTCQQFIPLPVETKELEGSVLKGNTPQPLNSFQDSMATQSSHVEHQQWTMGSMIAPGTLEEVFKLESSP